MNVVRLQIHHEYQPDSNPYRPPEVEDALSRLKQLGLAERGSDKLDVPGVIRHETGPEIIAMITELAGLAAAIITLYQATRRARPETKISVTVSNAAELKKVLKVLG